MDTASTLRQRRAAHASEQARERRAAALGLLVLVLAVAALSLSADGALPLHWSVTLALCVVALIVAIQFRERCTVRRRRAAPAVGFWEQAAAREQDRWDDLDQDAGAPYADPEHPYANDLDLFGPGSLFARINTTRTTLGRDALAHAMLGQDQRHSAAAQQAAVTEMAEDHLFREALHVELQEFLAKTATGKAAQEILAHNTRSLSSWGAEAAPAPDPAWRVGVELLCAAGFLTAAGFVIAGSQPWSLLAPFWLLNYVILGRARDVDDDLEQFESVRHTLDGWARILRTMEEHAPTTSAPLHEARQQLEGPGGLASRCIADLDRRVERLAWRGNVFWALTFDVALLWDLHARRSLHHWKRRHGDLIDQWLSAAAAVEACAALGSYAAHAQGHCTPGLSEDTVFTASGLSHPLLPADGRVGNDVELQRLGELILVTGSNMSGKSTFLRALGLAAVMARCGLPVCAASADLRPLTVVTCMRIQDDLARGSSLFHAEVRRLARCVEEARASDATLVLLDEILAGTNSDERHIGTEGVLRGMSGTAAVTVVATHDLSLRTLVDEAPDRGRLLHFRDTVTDGLMDFDYQLRDGPCESTNALRVMRDAGLRVD